LSFYFCEGNGLVMLWSESPRGMQAKLPTVAASNSEDHTPCSFYYCLCMPLTCGCHF